MRNLMDERERLAAGIRQQKENLKGTCRNANTTLCARENEVLKNALFQIEKLARHVEQKKD
jgi:hypothetical protein